MTKITNGAITECDSPFCLVLSLVGFVILHVWEYLLNKFADYIELEQIACCAQSQFN